MRAQIVDVVAYDGRATSTVGDVAAGAQTLTVRDASGLLDTGRVLIDEQKVACTVTDLTAGTLALADPLTAAAVEGTTVAPLDVRDEPLQQRLVNVLLDDEPRPVPALVPSAISSHFQVGDALAGADVEVHVVNGRWQAAGLPEQRPAVDLAGALPQSLPQSAVAVPAYSVRLASNQTIPHLQDTVLTLWEGESGTDEGGGDDDGGGGGGGAPVGGGGFYKSTYDQFRWSA